jgi:rare lipoprotein A
MGFKNIMFLIIVLMAIMSCAKHADRFSSDNFHGFYKIGEPYKVQDKEFIPKEQPEYDEVGMSSWYGTDFHGKQTANGDTYDKNSLTAAHNTLPLPSMVRITNLENNKTLIVMVNDRGPFSKGRIIDVSERAAEILGYKDKGVAKVRVQFLKGHTKRLLADLPNAKKSSIFSFKDNSVYADSIDDDKIMSGTPTPLPKAKDDKDDVVALAPATAAPAKAAKTAIATTETTGNITVAKAPSSNKKATAKKATKKEPTPEKVEVIDTEFGAAKFESEPAAKTAEKPVASAVEVTDKNTTEPKVTTEAKNIKKIEKHFIQAGTFSVKANAEKAERVLKPLGDVAIKNVTIGGKSFYRVRLGPIDNIDIAKAALQKVIKLGHPDAMLFSDMVSVEE